MKWTVNQAEPVVPVVVQIDFPFCLHIQDGTYVVDLEGVPVEIQTRKRWRNSQDCSNDDSVDENRKYFPKGVLVGGEVGGDAAAAQQIVGTNLEFAGDRNGYFRYTEAVVGLTYPADEESTASEIAASAVTAANRLIDAYRYVTGAAYLPRLRVRDLLYVQTGNPLTGDMTFAMLFRDGLQIAVVNESAEVHEKLRSMVAAGESVPIHADLILAAVRALWENDFRLAVVEGVGALDVYVMGVLEGELVGTGSLSGAQFDLLIREEGQNLTQLMKKPLRLALGVSPADDTGLWNAWLEANRIRREVTHEGRYPVESEARHVVRTAQRLLEAMGDSGLHLAEEMPT